MSFAKRQYEKWLDEHPEEVEDLNEEAAWMNWVDLGRWRWAEEGSEECTTDPQGE